MTTPWHHEKRVRLSEQKTAKLFLERNGCCGICGRKLWPGDDYIVEHVIALENGGTNDWSNLGITCTNCKPKKDAKDHGEAAKNRSKGARHFVSKSMKEKSSLSKKPGYKFNWKVGRYERIEG